MSPARRPRQPRPRLRCGHHDRDDRPADAHDLGPGGRHAAGPAAPVSPTPAEGGGRGLGCAGRAHDGRWARGVNLVPTIDRDRRQLVAVWLVQRGIGLLFALFFSLLALVTLRATWLGTVRAGSLERRAITQQVEDLTVAARRGTVTDRRGLELAVSEDAVTVFANPFLIDRPDRVAARLAPNWSAAGRSAARPERPAEGLHLPSPEDGRDPRGAGRTPRHRGRRDDRGATAKLPPGAARVAAPRHRGHGQLRALRPRVRARRGSAATTAGAGSSRRSASR